MILERERERDIRGRLGGNRVTRKPSSVGDFENSVFSKPYVLPAKYIYIFTFFIYFWYVVRVFFFFFFFGGESVSRLQTTETK